MTGILENPQTVARERVEWGAAVLDAALPGWERYIDVPGLDMSSLHRCVLAQLDQRHPRLDEAEGCDPYCSVLGYLYPDWRPLEKGNEDFQVWPQEHGFFTWLTTDGNGSRYDGVTYDHLDEAWANLLEQRQAAE